MFKKSLTWVLILIFGAAILFGSTPVFALGEEGEDLNIYGIGKPIPPEELFPGGKGENVKTDEPKEPVVKSLSLEEATKIAMENNLEMAINQIAIAKAKVALDEAKELAKEAKDAEDADFDLDFDLELPFLEPESKDKLSGLISGIAMSLQPDSLDLARGIYVGPKAAQMSLALSKKGAEFAEKALSLTVEKAYYDVLKAEEELANKKGALERAREQLRLAELSYNLGLVAKSDVMGAQVGVSNGEVELLAAENNLSGAMMALAQAMGEEITSEYILTDRFSFEPLEEIDLDEYLEELYEEDLGVVAAREGFLLAQVDLEQVAKIYSPNVWVYQKSKFDRDNAYLQYQQAKRKLEVNVRQSFLNLKTAEKAYELLRQSVEYAKENARIAALRYEAGMGTQLEMEMANDQLNEVETQAIGMLYNYNLAKSQIHYGLFLDSAGGAGMGGNDA